jgi:hypothetical protein
MIAEATTAYRVSARRRPPPSQVSTARTGGAFSAAGRGFESLQARYLRTPGV